MRYEVAEKIRKMNFDVSVRDDDRRETITVKFNDEADEAAFIVWANDGIEI
jgi:hypothetical protein